MSYCQTERLARERGAVTEIAQTLTEAAELPSILNALIVKILEVIEPAETGMIFLWDDSIGMLRPSAVAGYDPGVFKEIRLQKGESLPGEVFSLGKARLYTSSTEIAKSMENLRSRNLDLWRQALGKEHRPNSILAAPISNGNQKHGVMVLEMLDGSTSFSKQDLAFIQLIANLVSMSVGHAHSVLNPVSHAEEHIRTEWVETISHELGMPLTAIKGYATALLLDDVEWSLAKRQEFLQLIEDECDQMETLLSDLLNSTLIDMDEFSLELQSLHLSQVAHQITEEMELRTDKHHLIVDFPVNYPAVQADPRWIKQVFRNLLDNAIKYSPEGGLIVIRGEVRSSDVAISISDQGVGIPSEDLIPVFDKYVRVKSPTGVQSPGTGLGLPIVRTIVEAHGGHIWADSTINQGTTMSFSLPYDGLSKLEIGDRNESGARSGR